MEASGNRAHKTHFTTTWNTLRSSCWMFHRDERPKYGNGNSRPLSSKSTRIDTGIF
jgi:hypothetical protein